LFETVFFSKEDAERSRFYRDNAQRAVHQAKFTDTGEYLTWLNQVARVGDLDRVNLARMAQLVNKSNQFNLTTIRYTESELLQLADGANTRVRYYRLADRYGDNGLISVVVLSTTADDVLEVTLWVMSCRVLARTMEEFICNDIIAIAVAAGCRAVLGRFRPTPKNKLVADLYERLGFARIRVSADESLWRLDLAHGPVARPTFVFPAKLESRELADAQS
jgi:FkbH-like protein